MNAMNFKSKKRFLTWALALLISGASFTANAFTLFDTAQTIDPKTHSLGVEIPAYFDEEGGLGIQARYKYGYDELWNFQGLVGAGTGDLGVRLGGGASYYLIPDADNQPGVTLASDINYARFDGKGAFAVGFIPMVHKTLIGENMTYSPFVGLPLRLWFRDGAVRKLAHLALGTGVKPTAWKYMRLNVELGLNLSRWHSYFAVGASINFDAFDNIRFE